MEEFEIFYPTPDEETPTIKVEYPKEINLYDMSWYKRWFYLFKQTVFSISDQKDIEHICKVAGIHYKTPFEKFLMVVCDDIKGLYKFIRHTIIFYTLYLGVRLNLVSESTFLSYAYYWYK